MAIHTKCRICGRALPEPFLDLGTQPLANQFLADPSEFSSEARFPLAVAACVSCGLVQLTHVVPAEQLYRNYIYVSSTSEAVTHHAEWLAAGLVAQHRWGSDDLIVEVASNDGTVLKAFKRQGVRVLGIEPARNIATLAEAAGVPTMAEFFAKESALVAAAAHGQAAAILGRHVFAHVDDVHGFLDGVTALLRPDGVFIIEVPYLGDLFDRLEFDTIYHEHLSYISLAPMRELCRAHGLELVDAQRIALHGGSMLLHMRRQGTAEVQPRLVRLLDEERTRNFSSPEHLEAFAGAVDVWKGKFDGLMSRLVASGAAIVGYGAAAKGNTLLNCCPDAARSIHRILDRNALKHGRYTPGTHIPVMPVDEWERDPRFTHMLILAWNFQEEIIRQMKPFEAAGGRFILPIPEPRVV